MDPATRLEFRQELQGYVNDLAKVEKFRRYVLDIVLDARAERGDLDRVDPGLVDIDDDELHEYVNYIADRMGPELAKWAAGWVLTNIESVDDWRERRSG